MGKKEVLVRMIGLSGEMPVGMVVKLLGSATYAAALITSLKKDGLIAVRNRDGIKGYVLRAKAKKILMNSNADDFAPYMTGCVETNHVRSEPQRRLRLHRMSMAWVFAYQAGAAVFITEKPPYPPSVTKIGENPAYYGTAEFKKNVDQAGGSRACGVLCTKESAFAVYHTMDRLMKWVRKTERAMRSCVEGSLVKGGYMHQTDAIMIGSTMDTLLLLLESNGGPKGNLFQVDDVYDHYYFIPMEEDSFVQMKLLTDRDTEERFQKVLRRTLERRETKEYALKDGFDQNGRSVYFLYKLDIMRLMRIKHEMMWEGAGVAYCLDFQEDVLHEYFGMDMELRPIISTRALEYLCGREMYRE